MSEPKISKEEATEAARVLVAQLADNTPPHVVYAVLANQMGEHPAIQRAAIAIEAAQRAAVALVARDLEGLIGAQIEKRRGERAVSMLAKLLALVGLPALEDVLIDGCKRVYEGGGRVLAFGEATRTGVGEYHIGIDRSRDAFVEAARAEMDAKIKTMRKSLGRGVYGPGFGRPGEAATTTLRSLRDSPFLCHCGKTFGAPVFNSPAGYGCCSAECAAKHPLNFRTEYRAEWLGTEHHSVAPALTEAVAALRESNPNGGINAWLPTARTPEGRLTEVAAAYRDGAISAAQAKQAMDIPLGVDGTAPRFPHDVPGDVFIGHCYTSDIYLCSTIDALRQVTSVGVSTIHGQTVARWRLEPRGAHCASTRIIALLDAHLARSQGAG